MRALVFAFTLTACAPAPSSEAPATPPTATATESAEAALAALPSWETARAQGVDFRAVGQEPGWILDIYTQGRIVLVWDYGENRIELPLPEPTYPQEGATRYETQGSGHMLVVTTRRFPCQDAMSGEAFPATVEVVIDGRTLLGCGRSV
jgi:putative lipoprotein